MDINETLETIRHEMNSAVEDCDLALLLGVAVEHRDNPVVIDMLPEALAKGLDDPKALGQWLAAYPEPEAGMFRLLRGEALNFCEALVWALEIEEEATILPASLLRGALPEWMDLGALRRALAAWALEPTYEGWVEMAGRLAPPTLERLLEDLEVLDDGEGLTLQTYESEDGEDPPFPGRIIEVIPLEDGEAHIKVGPYYRGQGYKDVDCENLVNEVLVAIARRGDLLRRYNPLDAASLADLYDRLTEWGASPHSHGELLPVFGGEEPLDTWGIWSWDQTHVLGYDDNGWWIGPREEVDEE